MKGYVNEDNLFIVHDALDLITAKETIKWMKYNNNFHCLLLSMNVFQDGTPYAGRPVGNSPEFKPLDNSFNRDILNCLHFHFFLEKFCARRGGNRQGGEE